MADAAWTPVLVDATSASAVKSYWDDVAVGPGAGGTPMDGSSADIDTHTCPAVFEKVAARITGRAGHDSATKRLTRANSIEACGRPMDTAAPYVLPPSIRPMALPRISAFISNRSIRRRLATILPGAEYGPGADGPYGF